MKACKLVFLHEHPVNFARACKSSDYYVIDEYKTYQKKETKENIDKNDFFYLNCDKGCILYPMGSEAKSFKIILKEKPEKLINYLGNNDKVIKVIVADSLKNVTDDRNCKYTLFCRLKTEGKDEDDIYIGTAKEKLEFFYSKFVEYESQYQDQKKYISMNEAIIKENNELNEKYKQLDSSKKELENNYNKKTEENDRLKSDINNLKDKNEELENQYTSIKSRINFLGDINDEEETYDIIIPISSMLSLSNEGWKIKYPKGKEQYLQKAKKKTIIVGVLGNGNKGKSFMLGKLSDYKVPQGFTIKTEGLSVRYGEKEDHCIAILDSLGQETPLLNPEDQENTPLGLIKSEENKENKENKENEDKKENEENKENEDNKENNENKENEDKKENKENKDNKESLESKENKENKDNESFTDSDENAIFEKSLRDKLITETYIQQFIIETSHILILVVGIITLNEQKLLERVKKALKGQKYLYVIHNLQNFNSKEQVEGYIENTLKKLFGIEIEEINFQNMEENHHKKYYVEKQNIKITHLIFVNDYCSIAPYYNEPTITFLKKKLDVEQNRTEFSVVEKCKKYLIQIQSDILEGSIEKNDFLNEEDKIILNKKEIKLRKVFVDEIGKTIANRLDEPYYYYFTEGNYFFICIEVPGEGAELKTKYERSDLYYIFSFKGIKPGTNEKENEVHKFIKNTRKASEIKLYIRIPLKSMVILPNSKGKTNYEEKDFKDGVFTFKYLINIGDDDNEYE